MTCHETMGWSLGWSPMTSALCALCALGALPAHAKVLDVQVASPAPASLTTPDSDPTHPYCRTCSGERYQLIRGDDEVDRCNDRLYCDCQDHKQLQCGYWMAFNPDRKKCAMLFSCKNWLDSHP
ncbi:Endothelin-converting enzyme 2, partial [Frankliniella fusca]